MTDLLLNMGIGAIGCFLLMNTAAGLWSIASMLWDEDAEARLEAMQLTIGAFSVGAVVGAVAWIW